MSYMVCGSNLQAQTIFQELGDQSGRKPSSASSASRAHVRWEAKVHIVIPRQLEKLGTLANKRLGQPASDLAPGLIYRFHMKTST